MKISQERNDPEEGFCLPSAKENWSENCSQASCMDAAQWWASHCKARILDVQIWRRVRWHQGFPLITRAFHTLLIQIKGIHIRFHISLIILYMVLHVHLGSELHPYISSFLWSLLLHLLFWNISNYLGAQLFVMWSLSLCWEGIFRKKKKRFVMMMMMLYADFKKTWPFMLIEILNDFPTSKLWKNLSFKSFSNFSFVVDEVFLAAELQQKSLCNRSACIRRAWMKQLGPTKHLVHRPRCGKYFLEIAVSIRNEDAILGWESESLRGLFQPLLTVFWHSRQSCLKITHSLSLS